MMEASLYITFLPCTLKVCIIIIYVYIAQVTWIYDHLYIAIVIDKTIEN